VNVQHLSDEAVAAFADGVLGGLARERARRHTASCAECANAVQGQREAAYALRAAGPPSLPGGLLERLRAVPETTPVTLPPTVVGPDGSTMLATFASAAAFVPPSHAARTTRRNPMITGAAVVALTGVLAAGAVVYGTDSSSAPPPASGRGTDQVQVSQPLGHPSTAVLFGTPVSVFRAAGH
jgi:hypothetical protein